MAFRKNVDEKFGVRLEDVQEDAEGRVFVIFPDEIDEFESWDEALKKGVYVDPAAVTEALESGEWIEEQVPQELMAPDCRYLAHRGGEGLLSLGLEGEALLHRSIREAFPGHWLEGTTEPWPEDPVPTLREDWDEARRRLKLSGAWDRLTWADVDAFEAARKRSRSAPRKEAWVIRAAISALVSVIAREVSGTIEARELFWFRVPVVRSGEPVWKIDSVVLEWRMKPRSGRSLHELWESEEFWATNDWVVDGGIVGPDIREPTDRD